MHDQIEIRDLSLRTVIGIGDEERKDRQEVLLQIVLFVDSRDAGITDDVDDTVNYRTLTKKIIALVEGSQFHLVEKLASEVATLCLMEPRVERVRVTAEKPGALRFARSVGVTLERGRGGE